MIHAFIHDAVTVQSSVNKMETSEKINVARLLKKINSLHFCHNLFDSYASQMKNNHVKKS